MQNRDDLIARLKATGERIEGWRKDARRIRGLTNEALDTREVKAERLLEVEETAGAVYKEIADFEKLVADVADSSQVAAGELAEVGDALHLVLLEITELGTTMYSVRSREPVDGEGDELALDGEGTLDKEPVPDVQDGVHAEPEMPETPPEDDRPKAGDAPTRT